MKTRKFKVGDVTMSNSGTVFIYTSNDRYIYIGDFFEDTMSDLGIVPYCLCPKIDEEIMFNIMDDMYVGVDGE
jgi:hypothetical protein